MCLILIKDQNRVLQVWWLMLFVCSVFKHNLINLIWMLSNMILQVFKHMTDLITHWFIKFTTIKKLYTITDIKKVNIKNKHKQTENL
jgi:hypothetical protein